MKTPPFEREARTLEQCSFFKGPPGYQIHLVDVELRGHCKVLTRPGVKKYLPLSVGVWGFPPFEAERYCGELAIASPNDTTVRQSFRFPPGTRIATVKFGNLSGLAEYWKVRVSLGPFDSSAPAKPVQQPGEPKIPIHANPGSAVVPVARVGGFSPCVIQDKQGHLWAVFNDVGEFGLYPWQLSGESSGLWLMSSRDGKKWTRPDYLPVNSTAPDYSASLMQAEDGRLWLSWVSGRGLDGKHKIWISSSYDGKRWAHPRKVAVGQEWDMLGFPRLQYFRFFSQFVDRWRGYGMK